MYNFFLILIITCYIKILVYMLYIFFNITINREKPESGHAPDLGGTRI